jgi:hypothetical protein
MINTGNISRQNYNEKGFRIVKNYHLNFPLQERFPGFFGGNKKLMAETTGRHPVFCGFLGDNPELPYLCKRN